MKSKIVRLWGVVRIFLLLGVLLVPMMVPNPPVSAQPPEASVMEIEAEPEGITLSGGSEIEVKTEPEEITASEGSEVEVEAQPEEAR